MGLRFRKQIKLGKHVKLNIGKSSVGLSIGGKYAGVSVNSRTGAQVRASAPGTGVSYTKKIASTKDMQKLFDKKSEKDD